MIYYAALVLLGPVFWLQGRHVRRVTPVLPEPEGERAGQSQSGAETSIFIVGDSAAAGVGVNHQQEALSGQVFSHLHPQFAVRWKVCAQSGDKSKELLAKLQSLPAEHFDSAIVSIGVNDVTAMTPAHVWQRNLQSIVDVLSNKFDVQQVYLCSLPPMHKFPALPNPLRWWLGLRARQFSAQMATVASTKPGCSYVVIPYTHDENAIAVDGFHPGASAYKTWGSHIAQLVQSQLQSQ